ncbi:hypothetical protein JXO59_14625, partial [candidate division KSB1 bacterium]|nr:hypothetical protein [candidate division KSB1 bacterium]
LVMNTVEDLLLAERTQNLNDKYFLLCWRLSVEPKKSLITLRFQVKDQICKLDNSIPGDVPTVKEVRDNCQTAVFWERLEKAITEREGKFLALDRVLPVPLLISGGIFILDSVGGQITAEGMRLPATRTLVPLLEKDPASKTDAGRLTTPAGRMDILDLRQVCYMELCEEMIFYGVSPEGHQPKIYAVVPFELKDVKRRTLLRLLEKNVTIPVINQERIEKESKLPERDISLVEIIPPSDISLPREHCWRVEIYLNGYCQSVCENVIVIPDRRNGTLEFRLACYADITGNPSAEAPFCNKGNKQVGRLMGIADGDGFSRRPFLISAKEFCRYYQRMQARNQDELLKYLMESQHDAVELVAAGAPGNGRFESFGSKLPVLPLTTSVSELAKLLPLML